MPLAKLAEKSIIKSVDDNVCLLVSYKETNNSGETIEVLRRISVDSLVKVMDVKSAAATKPNICVDGIPLYPVTFVNVDANDNVFLRTDGSGEYLLCVPIDGVPRAKYMGNAVVDNVTGSKYDLSVSSGEVALKEII